MPNFTKPYHRLVLVLAAVIMLLLGVALLFAGVSEASDSRTTSGVGFTNSQPLEAGRGGGKGRGNGTPNTPLRIESSYFSDYTNFPTILNYGSRMTITVETFSQTLVSKIGPVYAVIAGVTQTLPVTWSRTSSSWYNLGFVVPQSTTRIFVSPDPDVSAFWVPLGVSPWQEFMAAPHTYGVENISGSEVTASLVYTSSLTPGGLSSLSYKLQLADFTPSWFTPSWWTPLNGNYSITLPTNCPGNWTAPFNSLEVGDVFETSVPRGLVPVLATQTIFVTKNGAPFMAAEAQVPICQDGAVADVSFYPPVLPVARPYPSNGDSVTNPLTVTFGAVIQFAQPYTGTAYQLVMRVDGMNIQGRSPSDHIWQEPAFSPRTVVSGDGACSVSMSVGYQPYDLEVQCVPSQTVGISLLSITGMYVSCPNQSGEIEIYVSDNFNRPLGSGRAECEGPVSQADLDGDDTVTSADFVRMGALWGQFVSENKRKPLALTHKRAPR